MPSAVRRPGAAFMMPWMKHLWTSTSAPDAAATRAGQAAVSPVKTRRRPTAAKTQPERAREGVAVVQGGFRRAEPFGVALRAAGAEQRQLHWGHRMGASWKPRRTPHPPPRPSPARGEGARVHGRSLVVYVKFSKMLAW